MTEIETESRKLAPALERFVLAWGEMGSQWGVNRSVAQIQALLYLSERPLTAEQIAETLVMARSNVSNSLNAASAKRNIAGHVVRPVRECLLDPELRVFDVPSTAEPSLPQPIRDHGQPRAAGNGFLAGERAAKQRRDA